MNYGASMRYHIEHACIIDESNLLLRGWSYSEFSETKTLISNLGFNLKQVPSMLPRQDLYQSNDLIRHANVGFMYFGPIEHDFNRYLNIELVSDFDLIELNVKLKHYKDLDEFKDENQNLDLKWANQLLEMQI